MFRPLRTVGADVEPAWAIGLKVGEAVAPLPPVIRQFDGAALRAALVSKLRGTGGHAVIPFTRATYSVDIMPQVSVYAGRYDNRPERCVKAKRGIRPH